MKEHYLGHRKRLKEKFSKNPESLLDYELLEVILGYVILRKDVKPIAKDLAQKAGSIGNIFSLDITTVDGVGESTALFFNSLREFFKRSEISKLENNDIILNSSNIYSFLKYSIAFTEKENFMAVFLDSKHQLIKHKLMSTGTVGSTAVYPREIAEEALKCNATCVIVAHNHPTGSLTPSTSDVDITKKIQYALHTLDIILLDHIIVSKNGWISMKSLRLF